MNDETLRPNLISIPLLLPRTDWMALQGRARYAYAVQLYFCGVAHEAKTPSMCVGSFSSSLHGVAAARFEMDPLLLPQYLDHQ